MTLTTEVLLLRPHAIGEVWAYITDDLLLSPDYRFRDEHIEPNECWPDATYRRQGLLNQGATAKVDLYASADGPVGATRMEVDKDTNEERYFVIGRGSMIVRFDSGGEAAGNVHAYLISALASRFGLVMWHNDYDGSWHLSDGADMERASLLGYGDPAAGQSVVAECTTFDQAA